MSKRYQSIHPDYEWLGTTDFDNRSGIQQTQVIQTVPNLVLPQQTQILRGSRLVSSYRPNMVLANNVVQTGAKRAYSTAQPDYNWPGQPQLISGHYTNGVVRTGAPIMTYQTNPHLTNQVVVHQNRGLTPLRGSSRVVMPTATNQVITTTGLRSSGYIKQSGPVQIVGNNGSMLRRSNVEIRGSYHTGGNIIRRSNLTTLRGSNHSVTRLMPQQTAILRGSNHSVRRVMTQPQTLAVHQVVDPLRGSNVVHQVIDPIRRSNVIHHQQIMHPATVVQTIADPGMDAQVENLNNELRGSKFRQAPPPPAA